MPLILRPPNRGVGRLLSGWPQIEYLPGGQLALLLRDVEYEGPDSRIWIARKGLVSDGLSDPQIGWSIVGPPLNGPYVAAAFLHDDGYRFAERSKADIDMMLWDCALACGTSETTAAIIAEAVAYAGMAAWEANARKRIECRHDLKRLLAIA